jgi:hypothetical protein
VGIAVAGGAGVNTIVNNMDLRRHLQRTGGDIPAGILLLGLNRLHQPALLQLCRHDWQSRHDH